MENKTVTPEIGLDVALKIAKQAGYLTKLTPLIKAIEPTKNLSQSLGFLSSLYESMQEVAVNAKQEQASFADTQTIISVVEYLLKHPLEFNQAYLVHRGVQNIENLSEEMQDRFWNAYADVNFKKNRPVLAELGTKTPMEVMAFVLQFPKPKRRSSVIFNQINKGIIEISAIVTIASFILGFIQTSDKTTKSDTELQIPQQMQKQMSEQDITALLHECREMPSTSENVHQKSDSKQIQRHRDDRDR